MVSDCLNPWTVACTRLLRPWDSPGKSTGVGCHFLLQGIFLTQGSNLGLPHCRQMLYPLSHQGSYRAFPITVVPLSISRSNIAQWKCIWLRQVDLALTVTSFPWASIIISLSGVCCLYHRFVLRNENICKIFAQGLPCIRCSIKRDMNFLGGTSGKDPVC